MCKVLDASNSLPALGAGISYTSAIEPLLLERPELFPVVEFEPQTTWLRVPGQEPTYRADEHVLATLCALPGRKIVHSVAAPVGGSVPPDPAQLRLLAETIRTLDAAWMSEHLSFNQTPEHHTGFFLPPRQTVEGLRNARRNILQLQQAFAVPVAVENGVSYLRPRDDEWTDGEFTGRVVETANCGLVLDLHNVYTNARNGRQSVEEFLQQIPLDRVWEIHLAGGMEIGGFWLDAHSGAIPDEVYEAARKLIPSLPHLKAIIFEIFPSFVPSFGLDRVRQEVERLHDLWALRPAGNTASRMAPPAGAEEWERALGAFAAGQASRKDPGNQELAREFAQEDGALFVGGLVQEFRASMITRNLRLTTRLLMQAIGTDPLRTLLRGFWRQTPPLMYASLEAEAFGAYLEALDLRVPHLASVLAFERASIASMIDGQTRVIRFGVEPLPLLRALAEGRLPAEPPEPGNFEVAVTGDPA